MFSKKPNMINIKDVVPGMAIGVADVDVPKWGTGYNIYGPTKFLHKSFVVSKNDAPAYANCNYANLQYIDETAKTNYITLPLDYQFVELLVCAQKKLKKQYDHNVEIALEKHLAHSGISLGSDPEIFVEDKLGAVIPAFNFLGSKEKPNITCRSNKGYQKQGLYWDGFQAEFTTEAGGCLSNHTDSVQDGLKTLFLAMKKHDKDSKLSVKTVMNISQEQLAAAKDEHVNFGCMPSLNAYGMRGEAMPGREVPFRPAGGHIHFGVSKRTPEHFIRIVKAIDSILGVASVSLAASFDDPRRRVLYGLAGEHRLPPHGMEYRVLSNFWLIHPMLMNLTFDLARKSFVIGDKGFINLWKAEESETIETINKCDVAQARKILLRNKDMLIKIFEGTYAAPYNGGRNGTPLTKKEIPAIFDIYMNGLESAINKPDDIAGNWLLEKEWGGHCNHDSKDVASSMIAVLKGKKVA